MTLRAEKALVSLGLASILGPGFFWVARMTEARSTLPPAWLATWLDQICPLIPAAVLIYLSWYPATLIVLVAERTTFRRAYAAYVLAFAMCVAGYLVLPVTISRPNLAHDAGLSVAVLRALYAFDPPVNVFPSFHAAVAAILWRLRPASPIGSAVVSAWVVTLCFACVLTKQHYVLDVVAGLAVGIVAVALGDVALRWKAHRMLVAYPSHQVSSGPLS
jgi:membrane-associated phospholipid phosphatase